MKATAELKPRKPYEYPVSIRIENKDKTQPTKVHLFSLDKSHNKNVGFDLSHNYAELDKTTYEDLLKHINGRNPFLAKGWRIETTQGTNVHVLPYNLHTGEGKNKTLIMSAAKINPMQQQTGIIEQNFGMDIKVSKGTIFEFSLPAATSVVIDFAEHENLGREQYVVVSSNY